MNNLKFIFLIIFTSTSLYHYGQTIVEIPNFQDDYSKYVNKLEAGNLDIDYQDFRFSFLKSKQFLIAAENSLKLNSLENEMYSQMEKYNYDEIINIAKQMLSIDYTNMLAHKILRQTYKFIGDTANAAKYKTIQFGLLNSIVKKGDGQSCNTAWPVIQLSEEYFILKMIGARLLKQSIDNQGGICDKMRVEIDDVEKTYYFETSKIFERYQQFDDK